MGSKQRETAVTRVSEVIMAAMEAQDHLGLLHQQVATYIDHAAVLDAALTNKERTTNARTN